MAHNLADTEILTFDSQSPLSPNHENEVMFDTEVLDSPSAVVDQLGNGYCDTERLDDLDFEGKLGPACECEEEVVLDSEDEQVSETESKCARNQLGDRPGIGEVKDVDIGLEKRQLCSLVEHGEKESSVKSERTNKSCVQPLLAVCDLSVGNLDYICSEDPGESTEANALDFVDHYVSYNEGLPESENTTNSTRRRSALTVGAKGTCTLARRLKLRTETGNVGAFQWNDTEKQEKELVLTNIEASLINHHSARHVKCKEDGKEQDYKRPCTGFHMRASKCDGKISKKQQLKADDVIADMPDMYDIGINTQIAAEAMEDLLHGLPANCNASDTYEDQQKALDSPPNHVANNSLHLENSVMQKTLPSDVGSIAEKGKQRMRSAQKISRGKYQNQPKRQKLDYRFTVIEKVNGYSPGAGRLVNCENPGFTKEDSGAVSHTADVQRKAGAFRCKNNIKKSCGKVKIQNDCMNSPVIYTTRQLVSADRLQVNTDISDKAEVKAKDITVDGIITYRRKRTLRTAKTFQQKQTSPEVAEIGKYIKLDPWNIPRRKRTCRKVQKELDKEADLGQDSDKQSLAKATVTVELAVGNARVPPVQEDLAKVSHQAGKSSGIDSISFASDAKGSFRLRESSKKNVKLSGSRDVNTVNNAKGRIVEASNYKSHVDSRKKYKKNLPKSSLLRELIKLGVPESVPSSSWKDFRKRRDTTAVRILFSQHLDDDVLKQQKKIAARLGISIMAHSKDATHFVADNFTRTRNMLEAIALGKPVVTHLWLERCGQAGRLIDEKNYILRDVKKEKEIGFSMPVSLARANQQPLLKGFRVFITPKIKPDKEMISSLVITVCGQTAERSQMSAGKGAKIPDDVLIISCEEDYAMCKPLLEKGAAVYSSELLLNGIVTQKLEYQRHQLFTNHVKRNCRSKHSKKNGGSCKT